MISILQFRNFITNANLNQGGGGGEGGGGGGGGENPPSDGWFAGTQTYYIGGQATTLNEFGDGTWNGDLYSGGTLFTGTSGGVYYVNGNPATGVYGGTYYESGVAATGTSGGVYYVSGSPANGVYSGTYYQSGVAATGTSGGVYYVSGSPANGVYSGTYYQSGVAATGTSGGVYYVSGSPANGTYNQVYYENGIAAATSYNLATPTNISVGTSLVALTATIVNGAPGTYTVYDDIPIANMSNFYYGGGVSAFNINLAQNSGLYFYAGGDINTAGSTGNMSIQLWEGGAYNSSTGMFDGVLRSSFSDRLIYIDGYYGGTYYLSGAATTLDQNGNGEWQNLFYQNGNLFSGNYNSSYYINGAITDLDGNGNGVYNSDWYDYGVVNNTPNNNVGFASKIKLKSVHPIFGYNIYDVIVHVKNLSQSQDPNARVYRVIINYNTTVYDQYGSPYSESQQYVGDAGFLGAGQISSTVHEIIAATSFGSFVLEYRNENNQWVAV